MVAHLHGADAPGLAAPELAHHHPVDLAPLGTAAAHAVVTPTSEKAPDAANVGGPAKSETQCLIFEQPTNDGKRFATLRAHLALKGYSLHRTAAGDGPVCFYVTRWGLVRELRDIAAVRAFAEQVGATHA
jgi:hypothetical protein